MGAMDHLVVFTSRIDMYTEGIADLNELIIHHPFLPQEQLEGSLTQIKEKTKNRYFPAFEKVNGSCLTFQGTKSLDVVLVLRISGKSCSVEQYSENSRDVLGVPLVATGT